MSARALRRTTRTTAFAYFVTHTHTRTHADTNMDMSWRFQDERVGFGTTRSVGQGWHGITYFVYLVDGFCFQHFRAQHQDFQGVITSYLRKTAFECRCWWCRVDSRFPAGLFREEGFKHGLVETHLGLGVGLRRYGAA